MAGTDASEVKGKVGGQDEGQAIKSPYMTLRMGPGSHKGRLSQGIPASRFCGENHSSCQVREYVEMEGSRAEDRVTVVAEHVQEGVD